MKYTNYIFGAIIAILTFTTYDGCQQNNDLSWKYAKVKSELVSSKQNIQEGKGKISSLIDDLNSKESINRELETWGLELEQRNESLNRKVSQLRKEGSKVTGLATVKYVYEEKTDTLFIPIKKLNWTNYHYPEENDWTVRHKLWVQSDSVQYSAWDFSPVRFDMIISESEAGVYKADLIGPEYLRLQNLQVKTLPINPPKYTPDQFDWLLGGGYRLDNEFLFHAGMRIKKTSIFGTAGSDKNISINAIIGL